MFDKIIDSLIGQLAAMGVLAMITTVLVKFSQLHPLVIFLIVFLIYFVSFKLLRLALMGKEGRIAQAIQKLAQKRSQPSLAEDFTIAKTVWGMWYAGTSVRTDKVLDTGKVAGRVLLLNPHEDNEALKRVVSESKTSLDEVVVDIIFTARHAIKGKFKTRFYSQYHAHAFTIYDPTPTMNFTGESKPNSNNAWVVIRHLDPGVGAGERALERVYKATNAKKFNEYFDLYSRIWEYAVAVELRNGKLTAGHQQFEVSHICKPMTK